MAAEDKKPTKVPTEDVQKLEAFVKQFLPDEHKTPAAAVRLKTRAARDKQREEILNREVETLMNFIYEVLVNQRENMYRYPVTGVSEEFLKLLQHKLEKEGYRLEMSRYEWQIFDEERPTY